ncbi:MAG: nuclear transport factor 2 family protein [Acidobacteriota bacterium]|nr:nuclear transport factor 2 family protein [Acidobacteriota bacterium]
MKQTPRILTALVLSLVSLLPAFECQAQQMFQSLEAKRNAQIVSAVRAVIDAQRDAWNRGDVAGYMDGYARTADITFISGDSLTRGWQTVHDRYQKNYNSREKMGTLTFSDLETTVLSADSVMVLGRWHLQRTNDQPHGRFTLIFRRTKQGWRIIHDHTSSAS